MQAKHKQAKLRSWKLELELNHFISFSEKKMRLREFYKLKWCRESHSDKPDHFGLVVEPSEAM